MYDPNKILYSMATKMKKKKKKLLIKLLLLLLFKNDNTVHELILFI